MDKQFGFVAILDALGVSDYRIEECSSFISQKNKLLEELEKANSEISSIFTNEVSPTVSRSISHHKFVFPKMTVTTFGDTIIICWSTGPGKEPLIMFPGIALWLQRAVVLGIKFGILLRGSISVGEYLVDGNTNNTSILGPAIADANAWSGEADWFGVILTPHCRILLTTLLENEAMKNATSLNTDQWCVKYSVPLHQGKKELLTISWPLFFFINETTGPGLVRLSELLSEFSIPKGVESKYENSIEFFKWFEETKSPKLKDIIEGEKGKSIT